MTILNPLRFFKRILRSNHQQERTEAESNPNETSDKTNKSTSKSSPTKSNKQKQQRFQEETPSEGSNRQWRRAEKEKETPDEESNRQWGRTEEEKESDDEVIEIEPPNIPKDQQEMLSEMKK
ncbi:hypothetical protein GLOIN_2v1882336 [Rhizophagus irregularis DAOM 181602=DAOM 197198]|nr:hypothetical protein GLOIN_2v1882336 [Rhizophagus irregularis DAOM 181602=DAOM 197198]